MTPLSLERFPLHLGLGARAETQPEFTGMEWYAAYADRTAADGNEGRLVSLYSFTESWTSWERHPLGDEVVICVGGEITLIQETAEGISRVMLRAGDYAINPRGTWHTADVAGHATALFITAGMGTDHRPRLGAALAEVGRKAGVTNADVEALEQTRDERPAEPPRFD